jgi:hypothetical protein
LPKLSSESSILSESFLVGNKISQIALLVLLLFSQIADAFACQSMSCMEKSDAMMTVVVMQMDAHTGHNMADGETNADEAAPCECCQQQCNCPPSMLTIAVLLESELVKPLDLASFKAPDYTTRIVSTILTIPQRPPKHFIS